MYGFSDQSNGIPCTRLSAERQGSSRYSTRIPMAKPTEHTFAVPPGDRAGHPAGDAAAAERPAARPLLPPARRGRLDARRHRPRPARSRRGRRSSHRSTAPVVRIFITHMHPDHVGGAEAARACHRRARAPGTARLRAVRARLGLARTGRSGSRNGSCVHGVPPARRRGADRVGPRVRRLRPFRLEPDARRPGGRGRRLARARDAGTRRRPSLPATATACSSPATTLLTPITPAIGLYPGEPSRPARRLPRLAAHGGRARSARLVRRPRRAPWPSPRARAREIAAHHDERLDRTEAALGTESRSGYDVSHALFGSSLPPIQRRFAVAETLSHLERLVVLGRARRRPRTAGALPILPLSWWTTNLRVPAPRAREGVTSSRASRRRSADPAERLLRGGRVRPRHRPADADHRARSTRATAARATCCESPATRRASSRRCSSASRSPPWPSAPSASTCSRASSTRGWRRCSRSRSRTSSSRSSTSSSASSCRRASRSVTRRGRRCAWRRPCAPSSCSHSRSSGCSKARRSSCCACSASSRPEPSATCSPKRSCACSSRARPVRARSRRASSR